MHFSGKNKIERGSSSYVRHLIFRSFPLFCLPCGGGEKKRECLHSGAKQMPPRRIFGAFSLGKWKGVFSFFLVKAESWKKYPFRLWKGFKLVWACYSFWIHIFKNTICLIASYNLIGKLCEHNIASTMHLSYCRIITLVRFPVREASFFESFLLRGRTGINGRGGLFGFG